MLQLWSGCRGWRGSLGMLVRACCRLFGYCLVCLLLVVWRWRWGWACWWGWHCGWGVWSTPHHSCAWVQVMHMPPLLHVGHLPIQLPSSPHWLHLGTCGTGLAGVVLWCSASQFVQKWWRHSKFWQVKWLSHWQWWQKCGPARLWWLHAGRSWWGSVLVVVFCSWV